MIKLKKLIPENIAQPEFDDDYIILGTIHDNGIIDSTKTTDGDSTHFKLGYYGLNWRYNPITQTVYWWELDNIADHTLERVENHLKHTYKVDVTANKDVRVNIPATYDDADKDANDWRLNQDKRDKETHPFSSWYTTYIGEN